MSGIPFPEYDDEPDEQDIAFRQAIFELKAQGFKPLSLVVPMLPAGAARAAAHIALLACEYELPVIIDTERSLDAGIGIRYEGDAPDLEQPKEEGEAWKG